MTTSQAVTPLAIEDYDAIESAVMETSRGRWFLAEYARRNRNADTGAILGTLERLERTIRRDRAVPDIDRIRLDLADMAEAISRTKQEIAQMKIETEHGGRFADASHELDAIVSQTENATNEILLAAEGIQEAAWTLREAGGLDELCDKLDTHATDIYTACSFQDLTGQRTRKVVTVLRYLESRITSMMSIWGLGEADVPEAASGAAPVGPTDARPDAHLLNGPQLHGQGIEQDHVDDLLATEPSAADTTDFDRIDDGGFDAIERDPVAEAELDDDREPDIFADDDAFDLAAADVFSAEDASRVVATLEDQADADDDVESGGRTLTITVGNTLRTVETVAAVATAAETAPELAVVASEDPLAALEPRRRIVTFG
ncbi:chemotaxis protein [Siculibacillus lacustris]|uniref:Chemotaxis protein n=1 Tax=Siculibacillus lacustris TaxID=1549641 RepID=A0A4V2KTT9_9HYPH|nr:protein phosphatase CheZ [Siculibacillus lacustris]TBW38650.1 chemotaxis protein [Siculibacillus lacustris]